VGLYLVNDEKLKHIFTVNYTGLPLTKLISDNKVFPKDYYLYADSLPTCYNLSEYFHGSIRRPCNLLPVTSLLINPSRANLRIFRTNRYLSITISTTELIDSRSNTDAFLRTVRW